MIYPRVNLLKKSERRYQGAVSRKFMLISIVVTPILMIAVISGVKLIQYGGIRANLRSSREIWERLEPRLAVALEQQGGLKTNREALTLFNAWQDSKSPMEELLLDIQKVIPENVQLKRISIRNDVTSSLYQNEEDLQLDYRLVLHGVSQGDQAEDAVIRLRRELLSQGRFATIFDSVKLTSMRKSMSKDGENMREFSLEGLGAENGEEL